MPKSDTIGINERVKLAGIIKKFLKASVVAVIIPAVAFGAQKENPRGTASVRNQESNTGAISRRSATPVVARTVSQNDSQKRMVVAARPAQLQSVKSRTARSGNLVDVVRARVATNKALGARSGAVINKKISKPGSRADAARATAIFNDVTKMGSGYANCRDAYATCMDQICANANDTYRRCFCSDRFTNFRETSDKLDTALKLLAEFQDNNLNAVDKTAAEVNAMYTATAGEAAIKKDTSASQKLLDSISDVLAGKTVQKKNQGLTSLGVLDFSGFGNSDDIWGGDSSSIFGGSSTNLAELEGKALYDNASKQCAQVVRESCGSDAMFNLAQSSYSILIGQDCNMFEKNINAKRASVEETVRTAEKYLRDARLDEYRAHNSQDVNECLSKVESAIRQPTACGEKYEKCMDYTGLYINSSTGAPIYSQALFGLNKLITLNGSSDALAANPKFEEFLDKKKVFASTALDTCRDLADTVWYEFKRSALIQIAQAQDEKIQQIKDSCVSIIKECYDTQSGALKEMDDTESKSTGAIVAVTARGMCYDNVLACAALYGDPDGCKYDDKTKKLTSVSSEKKCGLQSLLALVDTIDSVKVAEGCETALTKYAHELCDPQVGAGESVSYPMGCVNMSRNELRAAMEMRRKTFCASDLVAADKSNTVRTAQDQDRFNTDLMNQIIKNIYDELNIAFTSGCEDEGGEWVSVDEISNPNTSLLVQSFYKKYYGTEITNVAQIVDLNLTEAGWCVNENNGAACSALGEEFASFTNGECRFTQAWYVDRCETVLGGHWSGGVNGECSVNMSQAPEQ